MPDSPAETAGLETGDRIIAVDGEDVTSMDPALVRTLKVLGPAGTDVTLTVLREGVEDPIDVKITRAHIVVPTVDSRMLDNGIGYIQLLQFGGNSDTEVHDALSNLLDQGAQGIILDLRDNGGGYFDQSLSIASEFIDTGVICYQEYNDGTRDAFEASKRGIATDIPVVLLVNQWSASASEIVAGALQDQNRAELVGVTTFGKGVVQTLVPLSNGGTAHITSARWLTPNGTTIQGQGLTPDYVVEMTEDDYANDLDPQLDKAIQVLQEMIADSGAE
jgi:carboxyl-terminal processing protease